MGTGFNSLALPSLFLNTFIFLRHALRCVQSLKEKILQRQYIK